jgi:hypothetical protein
MLEFLNTYRVDIQHIASVVLALAIWRWGGGPERWLIGLFLATMVLPMHLFRISAVDDITNGPFAWAYFGFDLIAAAGFTVVALNANRIYPLWIAGFQLVALGANAIKGSLDGVSVLALMILIAGPAYCQLLLIFVGFMRHVRRRRNFGSYRDWRNSAATPMVLRR